MQNNTKKFLLSVCFGFLMCTSANAYVEVTRLCCDTANVTAAECCASVHGYWCEADQKCYAATSGDAFESSPCMTPEMCTSRTCFHCRDSFYWCEDNHKCYYGSNYVENCPDVSDTECWDAGYNWCYSLSKCIVDDYTYLTTCHDDPETMCKKTIWGGYWCSGDGKCYTGYPSLFYWNCPDVDDTLCKTRLGQTNHWCDLNHKCYYDRSEYNSKCK